MQIGARNKLLAEVVEVKRGSVMCEVKVRLKPKTPLDMSSVMTLSSLDEMGIKPGDEVEVIVKAVNVLLVKD